MRVILFDYIDFNAFDYFWTFDLNVFWELQIKTD